MEKNPSTYIDFDRSEGSESEGPEDDDDNN